METFSNDQWLYEGVTLCGLNRPEEELAAVELYDCTVRGARLGSAKLRRWAFEDCRFEDCDLSNAVLTDCVFQRCVFTGCRLVGIDWRGVSSLSFEAEFHGCTLSLGNFAGMALLDFNCLESECTEVDFSESDLRRANFSGSDLSGAVFDQTRLENANLSLAIGDTVNPTQNRVTGAQFSIEAAIRLAKHFGIRVPGA